MSYEGIVGLMAAAEVDSVESVDSVDGVDGCHTFKLGTVFNTVQLPGQERDSQLINKLCYSPMNFVPKLVINQQWCCAVNVTCSEWFPSSRSNLKPVSGSAKSNNSQTMMMMMMMMMNFNSTEFAS